MVSCECLFPVLESQLLCEVGAEYLSTLGKVVSNLLENLLSSLWGNISDPLEDQIRLKGFVIEKHVNCVDWNGLSGEASYDYGNTSVAK